MLQNDIRKILERFFLANKCTILNEGDNTLTVQLTIEMDKLLMNRPFYWHYLEKTGGTPQPQKIKFAFEQLEDQKIKAEQIHFGSPRLHQIFNSTRDLGSYVRLYEVVNSSGIRTSLHPWLNINAKIEYKTNLSKQQLLSIGINLISGKIVFDFIDLVNRRNLTSKIPDYCFTLSPLITPKSGINRIRTVIEHVINTNDNNWINDANNRIDHDLNLLNAFYEDETEITEEYTREKEAIQELFNPQINVEPVNGGIFYLKSDLSA
jgi:hypothetical protein